MTTTFRPPHSGIAALKLVALLTGSLLLPFAPVQAKTGCKPEIRYTIFCKHPAYVHGFNDGYDGLDYGNDYSFFNDKYLYDMGYDDGDISYLEDRRERRLKKGRF